MQKSYDSLTEVSMLRTSWISKTSAAQRKGRAGRVRPGVVFRLYSRTRHADFAAFQTPEVLRTPLMELCLHTKVGLGQGHRLVLFSWTRWGHCMIEKNNPT